MRKKILLISILICATIILLYLQFGRNVIVNNSFIHNNSMGYETVLTVTVNKLVIWDRNEMAKTLIQQVINNDFENVYFSYDVLGYPSELTITVYTNALTRHFDKPAFKIRYTQEIPYQYNIKDNPEVFSITYE